MVNEAWPWVDAMEPDVRRKWERIKKKAARASASSAAKIQKPVTPEPVDQADKHSSPMTENDTSNLERERVNDLVYQQDLADLHESYAKQSAQLQAQLQESQALASSLANDRQKAVEEHQAAMKQHKLESYSLANHSIMMVALQMRLHEAVVTRLVRLAKDPQAASGGAMRNELDLLESWSQETNRSTAKAFEEGIVASTMRDAPADSSVPLLTLDSVPGAVVRYMNGPGSLPPQDQIREYSQSSWTALANPGSFEKNGPSRHPRPATSPNTISEARLVLTNGWMPMRDTASYASSPTNPPAPAHFDLLPLVLTKATHKFQGHT